MFRALTTLFTATTFLGKSTEASTIYPTFTLSGVNGVSGSVFNGESYNDQSGTAIVTGDFNGDGKNDFAVGAPYALSSTGKVYVVYGSDTGFSAAVDLSALNGNNGFVILGESAGNNCGFALGAGDFNGDGVSDLAVGAYAATPAKTYLIYGTPAGFNATLPLATIGTKGFVVQGSSDYGASVAIVPNFTGNGFGALAIGSTNAGGGTGSVAVIFGTNKTISGSISISTLNGTTGFTIPGLFNSGSSGYVAAGDFNGDGLSDIAIGALYASPNGKTNAGFVIVVFGANKSFSTSLNASLLNGTDGFGIEGVSSGDNLGSSIGAADVNDDGISDLLIGAGSASPGGRVNAGSAFVLLGKRYFSAKEDLSKLNGTNGYRINGDLAFSNLGKSITGGRVNGDRFSDVIIGSPYNSPDGLYQAGSTFVIFGTNQSVSAVLELPGLNDKVLRIDGSLAAISSGFYVASADIRGDGYGSNAIIIGANTASPGNALNGGSTYVIYGDSVQSTNNQLTVSAGGSQTVTFNDFNSSVPRNFAYTQYIISGLQHGYFSYTTQPGIAISRFSGQDIIMGLVNFTHDDSELAPSCDVARLHTIAATTADSVNITFNNQLPVFVNKTLRINQGQTIQLGSTLAAVDPDNAQHNAGIVFSIFGCSNAYPTPPTFTQSQLLAGGAYFTHDNSITSPQCSVTISRGGFTSNSTSLVFDFDTTPELAQNHFDICQGQTKLVTANMLSAIHPGTNSSSALTFSIQNLQYGRFQRVNSPGAILAFNQAEVENQTIQFVHDGSRNPASFRFTISSNRITTPSDFAGVYFTEAPVLGNNVLSLNQGETIVLDRNMLDAVNPNANGFSEDLRFTVSKVKGGIFVEVNTTQNITEFNQSQISANEIAFESDGSSNTPSYSVSVANQCSETPPSAANIKFNSAPVITNNQLTITDGQPVILTSAQLSATDKETPLDLVITISDLKGGRFEAITLPGTPISVFPLSSVFSGSIRFVPESSVPAYKVFVSDGTLSSDSQALVSLKNTPSEVAADSNTAFNSIRNSLIGFFAVTIPGGLIFWLCKRWADEKRNKKLAALARAQYSDVEKEDEQWKQNTVFPVLKALFKHGIKCVGNEEPYIFQIEELLRQLQEQGIEIDLNKIDNIIDKNRLKNTIVEKIRQSAELGKSGCCEQMCITVSSKIFCCIAPNPTYTATQLKNAIPDIVRAVAREYNKDGVELAVISGGVAEELVGRIAKLEEWVQGRHSAQTDESKKTGDPAQQTGLNFRAANDTTRPESLLGNTLANVAKNQSSMHKKLSVSSS